MNNPIETRVWSLLRQEAEVASREEPMLASYYHATLIHHGSFAAAISFHLANKLGCATVPAMVIRDVFEQALQADTGLVAAMCRDIEACLDRDPACHRAFMPFLFFKGYQALQSYRIGHWLWGEGRQTLALFLQNRISVTFGVDIHPAAVIGSGILLDHATGVVVGETAVIEDDVSMLHGVTLGGSGCESGDRHPKIRRGVLISTGAKILGNIEIGECAKVAAGSVVLASVPAHATVAGVPARIVGGLHTGSPALDMDQRIDEATD
jgi:serine O-acetyltransferase